MQAALVFSVENSKAYCVKTVVVLTVAQGSDLARLNWDVLQNRGSDGISLFWRPCVKLTSIVKANAHIGNRVFELADDNLRYQIKLS